MDNILIVESDNDKYFIEAMIKHLNLQNDISIENWTICIDDYECMGGMGNLKNTLSAMKNKVIKEEIKKVGIVLDQDTDTTENKLIQINSAIKEVFDQYEELTNVSQLISINADEDNKFELACYLINLNGRGELEDILKEIKTETSYHSDCLDTWNKCLKDQNMTFKAKDLLKEWVRFYIRYDTCVEKERKQAGKKCDLKAALQKPIWDFNHKCLKELKYFLSLFKKNSDE